MNAVNAHVYIAARLLNALLQRFDTVYLDSFDELVNKYDCCLRALCTCKENLAYLGSRKAFYLHFGPIVYLDC